MDKWCWCATSAAATGDRLSARRPRQRRPACNSPVPPMGQAFAAGRDNLDLAISWLAESKVVRTLSCAKAAAFDGGVPSRRKSLLIR